MFLFNVFIFIERFFPSLKNLNDVITSSLLQFILGAGSQIKNVNSLSEVSRLDVAVAKALGGTSADDVSVNAFNVNYEDTGLFGFNLVAPSNANVIALAKAAVNEIKSVSSSITDEEVALAK